MIGSCSQARKPNLKHDGGARKTIITKKVKKQTGIDTQIWAARIHC